MDHTTILAGGCRNPFLSWVGVPVDAVKTSPWVSDSWRVDEAYIRVGGEWCYLYRAVTTDGLTLNFSMSTRRNTTATTQFLGKGSRGAGHRSWNGERPSDFWVICTDKAPTYAAAIEKLIADKELSTMLEHRQVKFLNNVSEGDYGRLKRILRS